jgi:hypothetical protein
VAGAKTTINGTSCGGSLRALNPVDESFLWEACLKQTVLGAVTEVPWVVAVIAGPAVLLVNAITKAILFKSRNANFTYFYGVPSLTYTSLIAVSQSVKQEYPEAGCDAERIEVIYNGIDARLRKKFARGQP